MKKWFLSHGEIWWTSLSQSDHSLTLVKGSLTCQFHFLYSLICYIEKGKTSLYCILKEKKKVQSNHEETIKPKLTEISLDNLPVWINYFSSTKDRGLGTFLSSVDLLKKMKELWQLNAMHNPIGSWIKTNKPNAIKDIIGTSRIILMWAVI